ncbi:uncharacterized protein LOC100881490 isoform X1 [Megachile rotundata]|uniref:uncharacterized protein LOC100881490 isoform X1 n=1 Tax=Megachile rotundata TaxID=143995 RepID=UPI003FD66219
MTMYIKKSSCRLLLGGHSRCHLHSAATFVIDNVYQPSRCESVIEEIRKCCMVHAAVSIVCDGIDTSKPYEHNTVDYRKVQR